MRVNGAFLGFVVVLMLAARPADGPSASRLPNIVYILADDLGYGDVRCFNSNGKIATPHLDALRRRDAVHGRPFRLGGLHADALWHSHRPIRLAVVAQIGRAQWLLEASDRAGPLDRARVPASTRLSDQMHRQVAPRHGLAAEGWQSSGKITTGWEVDYSRPIANGPIAVGFDDYFGISASLDMPPFVFINRDRPQTIPTVEKTWIRKGPAGAGFEAVDVLPSLVRSATSFIDKYAESARAGKPFLLYIPLSAPHTPILPTPEWRGKSGLNDYGDFVMQVNRGVGQILKSLETNGLAGETLVIFTSDNGCSPEAKFPALLAKGHDPSAGYRGTKADIFEGGHRIPFIVRWPGKVKPGTISDQVVCLNDLFATCADILGARVPDTAAEDSVSLLPALLGTATGPLREAIVHHSINGSFAIRQGPWKLSLCLTRAVGAHPGPAATT